MKIRLADVIGGAAKSLDQRLQEDMRRTEERAENTAKERRLAKKEQEAKDKEFEEAMGSYTKSILGALGPDASASDAIRILKSYSGGETPTLATAKLAAEDVLKNANAGIDIMALSRHTPGQDDGTFTMDEFLKSVRPASTLSPIGEGQMMGSGFLKKVDIGARIDKDVPIAERDTTKFDIGSVNLDRSQMLDAIEYSQKQEDRLPKTYEGLHVYYNKKIMALDPNNETDAIQIGKLKQVQEGLYKEWLKFEIRADGSTADKPMIEGINFTELKAGQAIINSEVDMQFKNTGIKDIDGKILEAFQGNEVAHFRAEQAGLNSALATYGRPGTSDEEAGAAAKYMRTLIASKQAELDKRVIGFADNARDMLSADPTADDKKKNYRMLGDITDDNTEAGRIFNPDMKYPQGHSKEGQTVEFHKQFLIYVTQKKPGENLVGTDKEGSDKSVMVKNQIITYIEGGITKRAIYSTRGGATLVPAY